jgi:hypothetical protein
VADSDALRIKHVVLDRDEVLNEEAPKAGFTSALCVHPQAHPAR